MKKIFAHSLLAVIVAFVGTACTGIEANKVGNQVSVSLPVQVQPEIQVKNEKISGSATVHSILGIFTWGPNAQAVGVDYGVRSEKRGGELGEILSFASQSANVARNAAVYNATTNAKADIILAPQYVLTTKDYFFYKSINCEVKGFPGFVKSVKVVNPEPQKAEEAKK